MTHEKQERVTCLDCLGRGRKKDGSGGTFACPRCGGKGSEPPEKQERIQGQGGAVCRVPIYDEDGVDCGKPLPCPEHGAPRPAQGQGGATPGPWRVSATAEAVMIRAGERQFAPGIAYIAESNWENRIADASLMAAAPELADALTGALAWEAATRERLGLPQVDAPDWAQSARAALRKAGRE